MTETPASTASQGRYREMQNPLDRLVYHPLALRLARMLRNTPVTPNMLSVAGALVVAFAGYAYVQDGWPLPAILGLLLHMSWHVFDGADGDLARLTGKTSSQGEIVDGICDYLGHIVLYLTIGAAAFASLGWWIWVLVLGAGASRVLQANFYESQRRQYLAWAHGVPWLKTTGPDLGTSRFAALGRAYVWLGERLMPSDAEVDAAFANPRTAPALANRLKGFGPSALSGSGLLGANYRTLALGASMFAGSPVWYFLYEIIILNIALALARRRAKSTLRGLRSWAHAPERT